MGRGYSVIRKWIKLCKDNGMEYTSNINGDTVSFNRIVDAIGYDETMDAVNWYFERWGGSGDPYWFIYNYDTVIQNKIDITKDRDRLARLKQATRDKLKENK